MKNFTLLLVCTFLFCNVPFASEKEESQKQDSDTSQKNSQEPSLLEKIVESVAENAVINPDYGKDITDR